MTDLGCLRADAAQIWKAGIDAVRGDRLVRESLRVDASTLWIGDQAIDLRPVRRIAVVGAGKAGASMVAGVEGVLGPSLAQDKQLFGWVNVPDNAVFNTAAVHLHAARPAGVNEPTREAEFGREILRIVGSLQPDDLCLCLISGGGSALLPAPESGISLVDKLAVTRHLSAAGANIVEMNTVRTQLSQIKGGGLAAACRAGKLVALIISDVMGDPISAIASGPTASDRSTAEQALALLEKFGGEAAGIPATVVRYLQQKQDSRAAVKLPVTNLIIGNNATAVDAAGAEAERLGYRHAMISATSSEGTAEEVGAHLAGMALRMQTQPGPNCLISGGEPTVKLVPAAQRGKGGRNQQLALEALTHLGTAPGIVLWAGGTDGEDGPTDAAGAWVDSEVAWEAQRQRLDPREYLARNDAYHFFEPIDALIKTGPTHTNVGDLRIVVVDQG